MASGKLLQWFGALMCGSVLTLAACGGDGTGNGAGNGGGDAAAAGGSSHTTLSIRVLPVDPGADPFAKASMDPQGWPGRAFPPIHVFGKDYQGKVEATLMMRPLTVGTPVVAPFDGMIQKVLEQPESCDAEMYLIDAGQDQQNHVSLDHVTPNANFTKPGAKFKAGDVIGTVPKWDCKETYGGLELMVVTNTATGVQAKCPLLLLDPARKDAILASITAVQESWNATGSPSAYTPAEMGAGICATELTSAV